jgi:proteasome alpha subunit
VVESLKGSKFGTDDELKSCLREIYKPYLYKRDVRPLGVGLIVGSVLSGVHLYEVDASGAVVEYRATCIGRRKDDALKLLASKYRSMTVEDARPLLIEALGGSRGANIISLSARGKGKK